MRRLPGSRPTDPPDRSVPLRVGAAAPGSCWKYGKRRVERCSLGDGLHHGRQLSDAARRSVRQPGKSAREDLFGSWCQRGCWGGSGDLARLNGGPAHLGRRNADQHRDLVGLGQLVLARHDQQEPVKPRAPPARTRRNTPSLLGCSDRGTCRPATARVLAVGQGKAA